MLKGLCVCYTVATVTFFSVAIFGYWAFGNQAEGLILNNFLDNGKALVPKWFILMTNIFTILQLSAVGVVSTISLSPILIKRHGLELAQVYFQPTNEVLESTLVDPTSTKFSA